MCLHAHHFFFKKNHAHTTFERLSNDHCTSFDCSTRRCRLTNRKPQRARFPPARSWGGLVVSIFDPLLSKKKNRSSACSYPSMQRRSALRHDLSFCMCSGILRCALRDLSFCMCSDNWCLPTLLLPLRHASHARHEWGEQMDMDLPCSSS